MNWLLGVIDVSDFIKSSHLLIRVVLVSDQVFKDRLSQRGVVFLWSNEV